MQRLGFAFPFSFYPAIREAMNSSAGPGWANRDPAMQDEARVDQ
jgi:hypothetical protein